MDRAPAARQAETRVLAEQGLGEGPGDFPIPVLTPAADEVGMGHIAIPQVHQKLLNGRVAIRAKDILEHFE
jgi:hypothetical protein